MVSKTWSQFSGIRPWGPRSGFLLRLEFLTTLLHQRDFCHWIAKEFPRFIDDCLKAKKKIELIIYQPFISESYFSWNQSIWHASNSFLNTPCAPRWTLGSSSQVSWRLERHSCACDVVNREESCTQGQLMAFTQASFCDTASQFS